MGNSFPRVINLSLWNAMKSVFQVSMANPFLFSNFSKLFIVKYLKCPALFSSHGVMRPMSIWGLIPNSNLILLVRAAIFGVVRTNDPFGFSILLISCSK